MQHIPLRILKNNSQTQSGNTPLNSDNGKIYDNPFKKTQQMFDNSQLVDISISQKQVPNINEKNDKAKKLDQHTRKYLTSSKGNSGTLSAQKKKEEDDYILEQNKNEENSDQKNKKKQEKENDENNAFKNLLLMLKTKIYFKQWRKFMPSRIMKVLGTWHYNLLSDKTIGFDIDKKDFWNSENEKNNQNENAQGNQGGQEEGFYQSELKNIYSSETQNKSRNVIKYILKQIPLFSASGKFRLIWDVIQMVIIMAFQYFLPLYITFKVPFYEILPTYIAYLMYFLLLLDILVNMNTTYYEKGKQVTNRRNVIMKYISTTFPLDILPIIPITIDMLFVSIEDSFLRFIFLIFIVKLNRMYSILGKIQDRFHLISSINSYMQLFKLLIVHLLVSHYFACLWLLVGRGQKGYNWMVKRDIVDQDWPTQYINSYYFITLTMITVGYGDITPQTNIEIVLCIMTMTFACGVFAYSVNEIGTLIQDLRRNQKEIKKNLQTISKYMHNKNISNELQYEIREYLLYYWTEESNKDGEKENTIINQLSDSLKETLIIEANHLVLSDSPVFRDNFSPEILKRTVPLIKEFRCTPEEVIYFEGETDEGCIYFIEKGSVEIYIDISTGAKEQFKPLKQLRKGDNFGAIGFFTGLHRTQSVRSLEFTTLLMIKREEFLSILQDFPQDYERFCFLRDKIQIQRDYQKLGLRCYSCRSFYHVLNDCPYLHYVANRFKVIRNAITGVNERKKDFSRINRLKYRRTLSSQQDIDQQARIYLEENDEIIDELYEHLESTYEQQTLNDNASYFKHESIGGQKDNNFMHQMSTGQDEDVRTSSMKMVRRGRQKNTMLPQQPAFKTRMSQDENVNVNVNVQSSFAPLPQPAEVVRRGERKGTIQIQHRQLQRKMSQIPPSAPETKQIEQSMQKQITINEKQLTIQATNLNLLEEKEFILVPIDLMKNFIFYFPHNNIMRVLQQKEKQIQKSGSFYIRNKKRSKRSTIKSNHKIETSSINSLYNKFEQQKDGDDLTKQQSNFSKYQSKNSAFSRRQSNKHNSSYSQRSSKTTLKSNNYVQIQPMANQNDIVDQEIEIEEIDKKSHNQNQNEENLNSQSKCSFNSDLEITLSYPIKLDGNDQKKQNQGVNNYNDKWGQESFGPTHKINYLNPLKPYFEEQTGFPLVDPTI